MTELQPLRPGAKMCAARKNDLNLPITLPIFNILKASEMWIRQPKNC